MSESKIVYQTGLPERFRSSAAGLYDEAFGKKFAVAIRSDEDRLHLLSCGFMLDYAIVALSENKLIGIAGFHTSSGAFTGGMTYSKLLSQLGFMKGNWAAIIFSLYERKPAPGELVMDGIAVQADARGQGVGSRLLAEITDYAKEHACDRVRLDVIDINIKAKKLYERKGFESVKTEYFPWLRWLLGFSGATIMELNIETNLSRGDVLS